MKILQKTMQIVAVFFLILLGAVHWGGIANAQLLSREIPMWEGVEKSAIDKATDQKFVEEILKLSNGDAVLGARKVVRAGWEYLTKQDPDGAIRRFNQAWLVNSELPDIFWGYAIATHVRGDELEAVVRWFDEAEKRIPNNPNLLTDYGRVLHERKLPERAKTYFTRSLAINPDHVPGKIGLMLVAKELGDDATYQKYKVEIEGLQKK